MNLPAEIISSIKEHLLRELDATLIIVFGSGAHGHFNQQSDIDLAFLSDSAVTEYELFSTSQTLAQLCGREIDLIDLHYASTVLKAQIMGKGEVIYSVAPLQFENMRIRAFKEYALLNEERAEILQAIDTRGSIYD